MEVRRATDADRFAVIGLLKEAHASSGMPFPFDAARADALFRGHVETGLVLVLGSPADGVLMAAAMDHPYGAGRIAKETVWFIRPEARGRSAIRMLDAYEAWAREQGCALVTMAAADFKPAQRLYERRGYAAAETHFLKRL